MRINYKKMGLLIILAIFIILSLVFYVQLSRYKQIEQSNYISSFRNGFEEIKYASNIISFMLTKYENTSDDKMLPQISEAHCALKAAQVSFKSAEAHFSLESKDQHYSINFINHLIQLYDNEIVQIQGNTYRDASSVLDNVIIEKLKFISQDLEIISKFEINKLYNYNYIELRKKWVETVEQLNSEGIVKIYKNRYKFLF